MMTMQITRNSTSYLGLLSVTAAAAFTLSACAPEDAVQDEGGQAEDVQDSPTPNVEDSPTTNDSTEDTDVSAEETTDASGEPGTEGDHPVYQAVETVLNEYPGGIITEFDDEGSYIEIFVYDGTTEWELDVDSSTFEIIDTEDDGIDDSDRQEAEAVGIEFADALRTAENEGTGDLDSGELDTEDGTVVYQIELTNDVEVYVDVISGEVVRVDS